MTIATRTATTREELPPFVTRKEFPVIFQEEFRRMLLYTPPDIKYQWTGMMVEIFAQKTDLQAILERIDAQGERIDAQGERIEALREDFNRQFAEHSRRMDVLAQRLDEHSRQIVALREDFNRGFALLSGRIDTLSGRVDTLSESVDTLSGRVGTLSEGFDTLSGRVDTLSKDVGKVDSHLGGLGARWGLMTESAFRDGLADILAQEAGLKVVRYQKMDTGGSVFGRPDQVEIDVVIQNGEHTLIELKSSISWQEVHAFARKVAFYEQEESVRARRMIIISPMFGPRAEDLADDLGMETFTSAYDVNA